MRAIEKANREVSEGTEGTDETEGAGSSSGECGGLSCLSSWVTKEHLKRLYLQSLS